MNGKRRGARGQNPGARELPRFANLPMVGRAPPPQPPAATIAPGVAETPGVRAAEVGRAVYVETYGCQMNVADSETVGAILAAAGYRLVKDPVAADIILINTCAVRENAEARVLGRASQLAGLRRQRPGLTLGILGCMAQHLAGALPALAPWVDLVAGPDTYGHLPDLLAQTADEALVDTRLSRTENYVGIDPRRRRDATNAWVTIIRGCDKFCTFCIVPFVRGRERSLPADEILRQVRDLAAQGFREVTLLGQTVNSYRDGETGFGTLLRRVAAVDGIERVRFTSPHPVDFDDDTIAAMAETPQVCPHLHLPMQSGSEAQLTAMHRGYTVAAFRDLVRRLRAAIPDLALSTDIIVGFCRETDDDFKRTLGMMSEIRFDSAFMFRYSERPSTPAARRLPDDVPEALKKERLQRVIQLQEEISAQVNAAWIGRRVEVLVEGRSKRAGLEGLATWFGRTPQNKIAVFPQSAPAHSVVYVDVKTSTSHTLYGALSALPGEGRVPAAAPAVGTSA